MIFFTDIQMENGRCKHNLAKGECWLCEGNKPTKGYLRKDLLDLGSPPDYDRSALRVARTNGVNPEFNNCDDQVQESAGSLL
jgi:hypothetical protein